MVARDRLGDWPGATPARRAPSCPREGAALRLEHRLHGHGRAALQPRQRDRARSASSPTTRASASRAGASPSRPPASCRRWSGSAPRPTPCSRSRSTRCGTSCATCWCRSTANTRSRQLLDACRAYPGLSNARRITFEYVMLKGVNDIGCRCARTGAAAQGHPGQDQPDPVQSLARARNTSARTGSASSASPRSSSGPATPRRCAPRAAATSWPPAASSRARPRSCAPAPG